MHPDVNFISLGGQATSTRAHSYTYTLLLWSWGQVYKADDDKSDANTVVWVT